jgi:hypothetical protein
VFIAGRVVAVARDGRVSAPGPRRGGRTPLEVLSEGPSGETRAQVVKPAGGDAQVKSQKRHKLDVRWHKRAKIDRQ